MKHLVIFNFLINIVQMVVASVKFDIPDLMLENTDYNMEITNPNYGYKFPPEGYILMFSLLKNGEEFSAAVITSDEKQFRGEQYLGFSIRNFKVESDKFVMQLSFTKQADTKNLEIRYSVQPSEKGRELFFTVNRKKYIIFQRDIQLYLPYRLLLSSGPSTGEFTGDILSIIGQNLIPTRYGRVSCEAKDGRSDPTMHFSGIDQMNHKKITKIGSRIITVEWQVKIEDHLRQIQCNANQQSENTTLKVFHYMTKLQTDPVIPLSNPVVPRHSYLKCEPANGYPLGKAYWTQVHGPMKSVDQSNIDRDKSPKILSPQHYLLSDNNSTVFINISAPLYSNWTLECRGENSPPIRLHTYLGIRPNYPIIEEFKFNIIEAVDQHKGASSKSLVIMLICVMIFVIVLAIFCKKYQMDIRALILRYAPQGTITDLLLRISGTGRPRSDGSVLDASSTKNMNSPDRDSQFKYSSTNSPINNINTTNSSSPYSNPTPTHVSAMPGQAYMPSSNPSRQRGVRQPQYDSNSPQIEETQALFERMTAPAAPPRPGNPPMGYETNFKVCTNHDNESNHGDYNDEEEEDLQNLEYTEIVATIRPKHNNNNIEHNQHPSYNYNEPVDTV